MTAGFLYGFTGNDYNTYFQTCLVDTPAFEASCCSAFGDLVSGNNPVMLQGVGIFLTQVPVLNGFLANCPDATASINEVGDWFRYWSSVSTKKLYFTIY